MTLLFRFVNSVLSSNVERKVLWRHIKSIRFKYLKGIISPKCINTDVFDHGFISNEDIQNNFEKVLQLGENEDSDEKKFNHSKIEINEAAKLFFDLNSCPSFYEKLYWKAIYGPNSRILLLASNILKRVEGNFKVKALKIFAKMTSVLGFQHISYKNLEEETDERNTTFTKNIKDVKGR